MRKGSILCLVLVALGASLFLLGPLLPNAGATTSQVAHAGMLPALSVSSDAPVANLPAANYDEQLGTTFTQSFSELEYNVTAVIQTDSSGYGPGYLLNGLSNTGYWYQVGISYDWPSVESNGTPVYVQGFAMNYEVFDSRGTSIFPSDGGGGIANFSGTVNSGDLVLLHLYFSGGNVVMSASDVQTGATATENFSADGSTTFVGDPTAVANTNGFFTGMMTEWYHGSPYTGGEQQVVYSNPSASVTSAWLFIDEFNANNGQPQFSAFTSAPLVYSPPGELQRFASNGATEYGDAYEFVTGASSTVTTSVPLTLSYTVVGGGSGYGAPTLTYVSDGTQESIPLTLIPTAYQVDEGSSWSVSGTLPGGNGTERWATNQDLNGTASSPETLNFEYFHQFEVDFAFAVNGASSYTAPTVSYTSFGTPQSTAAGAVVWADSRSDYTYTNPLAGSGIGERLDCEGSSGVVQSAQTIQPTYYQQYLMQFDYSVIGASSGYSGPTVTYSQFGGAASVQANESAWVDAGTGYSYSQLLGGTSQAQRWFLPSNNGTASSPAMVDLAYYHQFLLTASYGTSGAPSPQPFLHYSSDGVSAQVALTTSTPSKVWADADSPYSLTNPIQGSAQERWETLTVVNGTVSAALTLSPTYTQQFLTTAEYSVSGGGNPAAPSLEGMNLGQAISVKLGPSPVQVWLDAGSTYALGQVINSSSPGERWTTNSTVAGSIEGAISIDALYQHQYFVSLQPNVMQGGSLSLSSAWFNAGSTLRIEATPSSGWAFEGWHGNGPAFSNSSAVSVVLSLPLNETASFYPGLGITAGSHSSVTYTDGNLSGTISAGSSTVIYVPPASNVTLVAGPSSFLYSFDGWSGASSSSSPRTVVRVSAPSTITGNSGYDYLNLVAIVAALVAVVALLAVALRPNRR